MRPSYLKNAALLTGADVVLRLAGMGLRIWLANALGGEGMGLYQLVLAVYSLFVTLATSGVSVAATRLMAEELSRSRAEARGMLLRLLGAALLGADQWVKAWVMGHLQMGETTSLFPGFLELIRVHNYGAAWSSFSGARWLLIALTAFSRMYVGVHTPLDVGVSLIVGTVLVFVIYPFFRDMDRSPKKVYIIFGIFIVMAAAFVVFVELYDFPADIDTDNYASGLKNAYMILFCAVGLLLTFYVDTKYVRFPTQAVWWAQIIKVVVGLAILLALKSVLKAPLLALFGGHSVAHGVRYFIVILFAGIVWPMTFKFFAKLGKK